MTKISGWPANRCSRRQLEFVRRGQVTAPSLAMPSGAPPPSSEASLPAAHNKPCVLQSAPAQPWTPPSSIGRHVNSRSVCRTPSLDQRPIPLRESSSAYEGSILATHPAIEWRASSRRMDRKLVLQRCRLAISNQCPGQFPRCWARAHHHKRQPRQALLRIGFLIRRFKSRTGFWRGCGCLFQVFSIRRTNFSTRHFRNKSSLAPRRHDQRVVGHRTAIEWSHSGTQHRCP